MYQVKNLVVPSGQIMTKDMMMDPSGKRLSIDSTRGILWLKTITELGLTCVVLRFDSEMCLNLDKDIKHKWGRL